MSETPKKVTAKKATGTGSKPAEVTPKKSIKSKVATPAKPVAPKAESAPVVTETAPVTTEKAPSLWARIKKVLGL
jgi:hypothetical protein